MLKASDTLVPTTRLNDLAYHLCREAQERAAALASEDPCARRLHLDLADRHADRARRAQVMTNAPLADAGPVLRERRLAV